MTYLERLKIENENTGNSIILFNDGGLFLMVLERSAYLFSTFIKKSTILVRPLKGHEPFVHIGVRKSMLLDYLETQQSLVSYGIDEQTDRTVIYFSLPENANIEDFAKWKEEQLRFFQEKEERDKENKRVVNNHKDNLSQNDTTASLKQCFKEVVSLNIADITSMDALNFLNELQKKLRKIEL